MYLYVKEHKITGLKYFGFTRNKNPFKYKGSGLRWKYHLSKHGRDIHTTDVWGFDDENLCIEFAIKFSKENYIVNSLSWANLKEENGQPGYTGPRNRRQTKEHKEKIRQSNMGKKCPWTVEYNKTRVFKQSEESRAKIAKALLGKKRGPYSEEHKEKLKLAASKRKPISIETRQKMSGPRGKQSKSRETLQCPYCKKNSDASNAKRWHFENCRLKP